MFPGKKEPDKIPNFSNYRNAVSLKFSKKFTKNRFNDPFYYLEKNCQVSKCTKHWPSSPQAKCLAWTTCRNLEAALCTVEYSGLLYKCLLRWSKSNYLGNGTRKGVLLELRSETMPWKIFEKWKTEKGKKKKNTSCASYGQLGGVCKKRWVFSWSRDKGFSGEARFQETWRWCGQGLWLGCDEKDVPFKIHGLTHSQLPDVLKDTEVNQSHDLKVHKWK